MAANLSLTNVGTTVTWTISGLQFPWTQANYIRAGVATGEVQGTTAGAPAPSGIILPTVFPPTSGNATSVSGTVTRAVGTHILYAFAQNSAGHWRAGSATITIQQQPQRPQNWNWTNMFVSGQSLNITATEWNNFCSRINEFRDYSGLNDFNFTSVTQGSEMRANIANQARTAIQGISGYGTHIPFIQAGDVITANYFHTLRDELNAIP